MLLADDDVQVRVFLREPVKRPVVDEGRAYVHDVIEPAAESTAELVHKKLRLAGVRGANDERVEGEIVWVHYLLLHVFKLDCASEITNT